MIINRAFDLHRGQAMRFSSKLYEDVYNINASKEGISVYLEKRKMKFGSK